MEAINLGERRTQTTERKRLRKQSSHAKRDLACDSSTRSDSLFLRRKRCMQRHSWPPRPLRSRFKISNQAASKLEFRSLEAPARAAYVLAPASLWSDLMTQNLGYRPLAVSDRRFPQGCISSAPRSLGQGLKRHRCSAHQANQYLR